MNIDWKRVNPGWYEAEAGGFRWRIVQTKSHAWEVLRSEGSGYDVLADWPYTFDDAKSYVEDEVRCILDPEYAARREERRRKRRERS